MKKIFFGTVSCFIFLVIPLFSDASVKCPDNVTPALGITDPACYTSKTVPSGYWETCSWYHGRNDYECGPYHHSSYSDCRDDSYCVERGKCWFHGKVYWNTCSGVGEWCDNMGPLPDSWKRWKSTTSTTYKCYYIKVNDWEDCDPATGLQTAVPSSVEQLVKKNTTNCDNLNEKTIRSCGICGPKDGVGSQDAPTDPGLCTFGSPVSGPQLHPTDDKWIWTCEGGDLTTDEDDALCEAPRSEPGKCSTSYGGRALEESEFVYARDNDLLCDSGVVDNIQGNADTGWSWDCMHFGDPTSIQLSPGQLLDEVCAAPCFDYSLNIDKEQFYWNEQDSVEVTVNVEKIGACKDQYSCTVTIDGNEGDDSGTHTYTIDARDGENSYNVSGVCKRGDDEEERTGTVNGNCIERFCTSQGQCQGIPRSASGQGSCRSTCSTNADCSTGRMIETRP